MSQNHLQTLKGFRDFLPETAIKRNQLIDKLKKIFETFGFDPLETPALEHSEVLFGKYGSESDKLLYLFKDKGERLVGLRYDQTVPLARIINQYQNIIKPFKRYQIQPVWRAENTQKGRYREFLQCDVDIVGEKNILADFEIIDLVLKTFRQLGFKKTKILINDRKNFQGISSSIISSIDKLKKIGDKKVIEELTSKGLKKDEAENILKNIKNKKMTDDIKKIFELLKEKGYKENENFIYDPTLSRGLDYYTGLIFEVIDEDYGLISLGGGGRYDNLIGTFSGKNFPAVGFAFGFDRIFEAAESFSLISSQKTTAKVLVTIFSSEFLKESIKTADFLRENNINTEIYLNQNDKLEKQLKYADKKGINFVLIIGPEEIKNHLIKLRNMIKREEKILKLDKILELLKSN